MHPWKLFAPYLAATIAITPARAEQVIVRQVDYRNDSITNGGKVVACIVSAAVTAPPDPRVLNFQFLQFNGRVGWTIAGGIMDWKHTSIVAIPISDGGFSSGSFNVANAFQKSITPEGEVLGILEKGELYDVFIQAFFQTSYSIYATWKEAAEKTVYFVDKRPDPAVIHQFVSCAKGLSSQSEHAP